MPGRKSVLLGTMGLMMAVGAITAPSVSASTSNAQSALRTSLQMWEDPGYTGSIYVDTLPSECPAGCDIDGWDGDNEISSVKNPTGCKVRLYDNDGFTGGTVDLSPHTSYPNLEQQGFDNRAESYKFIC
jgi:peptidase inhibitor family I36